MSMRNDTFASAEFAFGGIRLPRKAEWNSAERG